MDYLPLFNKVFVNQHLINNFLVVRTVTIVNPFQTVPIGYV